VVVDREYGEKLAALEPGIPVWIVDTPINKPVAQRLWKERPGADYRSGITTFTTTEQSSPEDILIGELDTIDLHHGLYSADPPYTVLKVNGTPPSDRIRAELSAYGLEEFHETADGFTASRPV